MSHARTRQGIRRPATGGSMEQRARQAAEVVVQSAKDMVVDNGTSWAAAIAYYALLSIVPILLLIASVASFFVEPQWAVDRVTNTLGDFVPQTEGMIEDTVNGAIAARGQIGLLSFVALLWSGTRVFDNLTRAMNVTFDVDDDYSPLQRLGLQVLMLLTVGGLFVVAVLAGRLVGPAWRALDGAPGDTGQLMDVLTWVVRGALLFLAHFLLYRFVPRRRVDDRAIVIGATFATVGFMLASAIFGYFIRQYGSFEQLYGPLAVVMIIIAWVGIGAHLTVLGGEIVSHVQEMAIEGRSAAEVGRRHAARSPRQRPVEQRMPDAGQIRQKLGG